MAAGRLDSELASLRDVEGVIGSFVLGEAGSVLGRDLPNLFDDDVLGSVGMRVQRLLESFDSTDEPGTHLSLRYPEHKLYLHRAQRAVIAVISGPHASSPAMTMALTLVGRRISRVLEERETDAGAARSEASKSPTLPAVPKPVAAPGPQIPGAPAQMGGASTDAPPPPTRYSLTMAAPRAPEGQHAAPAPTTRPRYFRGRRVE